MEPPPSEPQSRLTKRQIALIVLASIQIAFFSLAVFSSASKPAENLEDLGAFFGPLFMNILIFLALWLGARGTATGLEKAAICTVLGLLSALYVVVILVVGLGFEFGAEDSEDYGYIGMAFLSVVAAFTAATTVLVAMLPSKKTVSSPELLIPRKERVVLLGPLALVLGTFTLAALGKTPRAIEPLNQSLASQKETSASAGSPADQAPAAEPIVFEDLAFSWTPPGRPWVALSPAAINPDAALVYRRVRPEKLFAVLAETLDHPDDMTFEGYTDVIQSNFFSASESAAVGPSTPSVISDIDGVVFPVDLHTAGMDLHYEVWLGKEDVHLFQLLYWTEQENAATAHTDALQLFNRFRYLPPEPQPTEPTTPPL